jgi:L-ascorbate metabolism protein UlaG (beta-lactamase superfamily)
MTDDRGGTGLSVTFLGHATTCIRLAGSTFLTDPVLRGRVAFLRWFAPEQDLDMVTETTATLISHLHHDHCDPTSLALLGRHRPLLVPAAAQQFFRQRGFTNVVPMRVGTTHRVGSVTVTGTDAAHSGRRDPFGPTAKALGYVLEAAGQRVYFAGDTDLFSHMRELAGPEVALLPVSGWGRSLGPGHLDPSRAAEAVELIRPRLAVPIHWGALRPFWHRAATPEGVTAAAVAFDAEVRRRALPAGVVIVRPGETLMSAPGRPTTVAQELERQP